MAETFKNQQSNPLAATLTDLYTVPGTTSATAHVYVANRSATATSFRLAVAPLGAVDALTHYIAYDVDIAGNESKDFTGLLLIATDKIRVLATLATLTFSAFIVEVT